MLIKFTATTGFRHYGQFRDGTIAEVSDKEGEYLLRDYGQYFSRVDAPKVEIKVETKAVEAPTHNKVAQPPKSNRGR